MTNKNKKRLQNVKTEYGKFFWQRERAMNALAKGVAQMMIEDIYGPDILIRQRRDFK